MRMVLLAMVLVLGALAPGRAELEEMPQVWRRGGVYDVTSQLHMSEAAAGASDVATRLRATLRVAPLRTDAGGQEVLLHFEVPEAWQESRGAARNTDWERRRGPWASFSGASWAAHWAAGRLLHFYADPAQTTDFLNYQRALTSLLQFQVADGEYNETDVSGSCSVLYEAVSADIIRKIKRKCRWEERSEESEEEALQCRRVTRVTLQAAELHEVFADEVCELGAAKARGWMALRRKSAAAPLESAAAPLESAAAPLEAAAALGLRPLPLPLQQDRDQPDAPPHMSLADAIKQYGEQLRDEDAGEGGTEEAAHAALVVLDAMQHATAPELREALHEPGAPAALWHLAGAAGGAAPHAAVGPHLRDQAPHPHAALYLRGLALALRPHEDAVRGVLRAAGAAAARAAGAAAARGPGPLRRLVAAELLRRLARCADDACRLPLLRALAGAAGEAADALLAAAEAGGEAAAAAALCSLGAGPAPPPALRRLQRLALTESRPLAVRGAALLLAVERSLRRSPPLYEVPARLAWALSSLPRHHELRRVLWGAVASSPPPAAARLLTLLPPNIRCWHTLANAGTSSVLERETGWGMGGWNVTLKSVQVAAGGVLRHGSVALRAGGAAGGAAGGRELLAVHVWTRGLQAWAGAQEPGAQREEQDAQHEDAAAGLALFVGGAALDDVTLFSSQSELLALLWAGAGSSDTAVLRAFLPLRARDVSAPLATAGVWLRGRQRAGAALALDAAASVSLWGRSAAARLQLRGAAAELTWLRAAQRGGGAWLRARDSAAAALRVSADLDFYGDVALCVRAALDPLAARRDVSLGARAGTPRHEHRRARASSLLVPGRTLALGRDNDVTCRTLGTADL